MNFHDYINDIPMDITRRFYPTPNINVDFIQIPDKLIFSSFEYNFEAESRAREQFDKQNETITLQSTSSQSSGGATSSATSKSESDSILHVLSQDVLVPCPVNVSSKPPALPQNAPSLAHSLHDFESINNVFDDVQILALDDRKALQEVLMNTKVQQTSSSSLNNNQEKVQPAAAVTQPIKDKNDELRQRLLTKGYRRDLVEKALECLPKNRLVHIEYYMKACRTVEKTGRSTVDDVLPFLVKCQLTDKHAILAYSETCATLLKMGFPHETVFEAVAAENGDQTRAIARILPNS